jgi:hypothetical protein
MSDVMGDEEGRSRPDGCRENRHILRVGEFARSLTVVRCRAVDLERDGAEELLEQRRGLRELDAQVPSDLSHSRLGEYQTQEAQLAQNQDRVAGAGTRQQASNQDVSIDTDP